MSRPLVKICGITTLEDARSAVRFGADFVGLNFWPESPRHITEDVACGIVEEVRGETVIVGVFVNEDAPVVVELADRVGLDLLQFHGDEDGDYLAPFGPRGIKVFRHREGFDAASLDEYPGVWGFLFDAYQPDLAGGTGKAWPYERLGNLEAVKPYLVAGGIGPDNVVRALRASGAAGVDVCSGVESSPGVKSAELIQRLFEEVRDGETQT